MPLRDAENTTGMRLDDSMGVTVSTSNGLTLSTAKQDGIVPYGQAGRDDPFLVLRWVSLSASVRGVVVHAVVVVSVGASPSQNGSLVREC